MKIGILTFHNTINYGGVLQCYALKEVLKSFGHDVKIIDYRCNMVEDYKKVVPSAILKDISGFSRRIKYILGSVVLYPRKKKATKAFNTFLENNFELSKRITDINTISRGYDYIVFGSDQIWSPRLCGGFDPVYWGQFHKGNTKFVTYAVSLGEPRKLVKAEWNRIGGLINAFDKISVRENELKEAIEKRFSIPVTCNIDPTLLCEPDVFEKKAIRPKENNYVFLFNVQSDSQSIAFAYHLAQMMGCHLIVGQARPRFRIKKDKRYKLVEAFSPEEFLGYIKYARLVVGNSFHAIALSLVFKKDFYSLDSPMPSRIINILSQIDLLHRHVNSQDRIPKVEDIDYVEVNNKLEAMRNASMNDLIEELKN